MTELEKEIAELRRKLDDLTERVRLDAVAIAFMEGEYEIREGDYFLLDHVMPTKLSHVSREGKWTYHDGRNSVEPYRIPQPGEHSRLYTIDEVTEIVAKVKAQLATIAEDSRHDDG